MAPLGFLQALASKDTAIASVLDVVGEPLIRTRPKGYEGLFRIIVAQQVSVASARAITARCEAAFALSDPAVIADMAPENLSACGLSGQKVRYVKAAAEAVVEGRLDFQGLAAASDEAAVEMLTAIKGVGPWTAAIYLLFSEGRLSIWPPKDVALLAAYTHAAGLEERPPMADFDEMATERFVPTPGLAAHLLWTYYGHIKERPPV